MKIHHIYVNVSIFINIFFIFTKLGHAFKNWKILYFNFNDYFHNYFNFFSIDILTTNKKIKKCFFHVLFWFKFKCLFFIKPNREKWTYSFLNWGYIHKHHYDNVSRGS